MRRYWGTFDKEACGCVTVGRVYVRVVTMATRLDAVLAAGMARMSVAPVPTGVKQMFEPEVYESIHAAVTELLKIEQDLNNAQLSLAVRDIMKEVARVHLIPVGDQEKLLAAVHKIRRSRGSRRLQDSVGLNEHLARVRADGAAAALLPRDERRLVFQGRSR